LKSKIIKVGYKLIMFGAWKIKRLSIKFVKPCIKL
jgi:hypothetical protein